MSCRDARPLLADYTLDLLDEDDAQSVRGHLATGCRDCAAELQEIQLVCDALAESVPLVEPPARLRSALLQRIEGNADATVKPPAVKTKSLATKSGSAWARYTVVASALAALLLIAVRWDASVSDATEKESDALSAWNERLASVDRQLRTSDFRLVSLLPSQLEPTSVTHVLYDELSAQLHAWVKSAGSPTLKPATHLWVLDSKEVVIGQASLLTADRWNKATVDLPASDLPDAVFLLLTSEDDANPTSPSNAKVETVRLQRAQSQP